MPDGIKWNPRVGDTGDDLYKWPQDMPIRIMQSYPEDPLRGPYLYLNTYPSKTYIESIYGLDQIVAAYNRLWMKANRPSISIPGYPFTTGLVAPLSYVYYLYTDLLPWKKWYQFDLRAQYQRFDGPYYVEVDWIGYYMKTLISGLYSALGLAPFPWTFPVTGSPNPQYKSATDKRFTSEDIIEMRKALDVSVPGRMLVPDWSGWCSTIRGASDNAAPPFHSIGELFDCLERCPPCPGVLSDFICGTKSYSSNPYPTIGRYRYRSNGPTPGYPFNPLDWKHLVNNWSLFQFANTYPAYAPAVTDVGEVNLFSNVYYRDPEGYDEVYTAVQKYDPDAGGACSVECPTSYFSYPGIILGSAIPDMAHNLIRVPLAYNLIDPKTPGSKPLYIALMSQYTANHVLNPTDPVHGATPEGTEWSAYLTLNGHAYLEYRNLS